MRLPKKPHGDKGLNVWVLALGGSPDLVLKFYLWEAGESDGPEAYQEVLMHLAGSLPVKKVAATADSRFTTLRAAIQMNERNRPVMLQVKPNWVPQLSAKLTQMTPNAGDCACLQLKKGGLVLACFHDEHNGETHRILIFTNMHDAGGLDPGAQIISGRAWARALSAVQGDLDPSGEPYIPGPPFRMNYTLGTRAVDGTNRDAFVYAWERRTVSWKKAWRDHIMTAFAAPGVYTMHSTHMQHLAKPRPKQFDVIREVCMALVPPPVRPPLSLPAPGRRMKHLVMNINDEFKAKGMPLPPGLARRKCKWKGCRNKTKTPFVCDTCGANLHPSICFKAYHEQ